MRNLTFNLDNSIEYLVCGQLISENSFLHQRRNLEENVLIMVTLGTLYINTNNVDYTVSKGEYIILKANELHYGIKESNGPLNYFWVHFNLDLNILNNKKETNSECVSFPEYGSFLTTGRATVLFHQLSDISFEEGKHSTLMCNYSIYMLLLELSKENSVNNEISELPIAIASVMDYIYKNYYVNLSVSELASRYGYTTDYFSYLFKKSTGQSLVSFINKVRIHSSKALLANFGVSIKEIAYSCGFPDEKYYMRIFKKYEGITPSQYRNNNGKSYIN